MSFRVLVIPEDPTYNGYILKPLIERVFLECGKPNVRVHVPTNPKAGGYQEAKRLIPGYLERYSHYDLLLFLPDADGKDRSGEFAPLEESAPRTRPQLICCAAVQEVETWLLAGHIEKLALSWSEIRENTAVKEEIFLPFLERYGDPRSVGGGREVLMRETLGNYPGLLARCPEIRELQKRIKAHLEGL